MPSPPPHYDGPISSWMIVLTISLGVVMAILVNYVFVRRIHGVRLNLDTENLKQIRITKPPGVALTLIADFFWTPQSMERIVRPIISDMQLEYFGALAQGRNTKAAWIRVRGYWTFWKAWCLHSIVRNFVGIWRIVRLK